MAPLHRNSTPRCEQTPNCQRADPGGESDKGDCELADIRILPITPEATVCTYFILGVASASSGDRKSRCLYRRFLHVRLLDEVDMVPLISDHARCGHAGRGLRSERMFRIPGRTMDSGASTARRCVVG